MREVKISIIDYIDLCILIMATTGSRDVLSFFVSLIKQPVTPADFQLYQEKVKAITRPENLVDHLNNLELILIEEEKWAKAS